MVLVCIAAKSVVLIKNIETLDRAQNRSPYWESVLRLVFYVKVTDMVDFKIGELVGKVTLITKKQRFRIVWIYRRKVKWYIHKLCEMVMAYSFCGHIEEN